jgi:hypothetical protein
MTPQELLDLKNRSIVKHHEIQATIKKIETDYIAENCPYKVGDKVVVGSKLISKRHVDVYGIVEQILMDYQLADLPQFRISLVDDEGKYIKTLYI